MNCFHQWVRIKLRSLQQICKHLRSANPSLPNPIQAHMIHEKRLDDLHVTGTRIVYGINRVHDESPTQTACSLIVNHYTLLSICLLWNPPSWVMTHDPWWTSVFHMLLNAQVAWTSRLAGGWISCGRSHWGSSGRYAGWRESNGAWRGRSGSGLKNWHGVRRVSSRFSAPGIIKVVNRCCSQQFEMNEPTFLAP